MRWFLSITQVFYAAVLVMMLIGIAYVSFWLWLWGVQLTNPVLYALAVYPLIFSFCLIGSWKQYRKGLRKQAIVINLLPAFCLAGYFIPFVLTTLARIRW
ncbi:MAG: hypothetical protein K6T83_10495 [Alicyclobacillus sp.]|nr:hypothetical protein [Alicyclobacillus sp.]